MISVDSQIGLEWYEHEKNVTSLVLRLAEYIGGFSEEELSILRVASINHDIGKYCISKVIWGSERGLSKSERLIVDMHSYFGYLVMVENEMPYVSCLLVLLHHGTGKYKADIKVEDGRILFMADMLRICDVYDALVSDRSYRKAMTKEEAIGVIRKMSFDDVLFSRFVDMLNET